MVEIVELKKAAPVNVVAAIEELLRQAKAGDVDAVAYVAIRPTGATATNVSWQAGGRGAMLLGGTVFLQMRVATMLLEA
jgi:hypothetical protein